MTVRSKATGAALMVAAPEAELAEGAAGAKGAGKAAGKAPRGADPRTTAPGSKAARQREAVERIKANRAPELEREDQADEHEDQADEHDGGGRFAPFAGMQAPATGGGFVLGVIAWAVVRAYIGNPGQPSGPAGVRRLLAAKFLNKTS